MIKATIRFLIALVLANIIPCLAMAEDDLTLVENINMPQVHKKAVGAIRAHMAQIQNSLAKHYTEVELVRDDEVVLVTLPCSELFAPNSIMLKEDGKRYLRPFLNLLKYPTMYKVLVAVHTDNTGDELYSDQISAQRANAIDEFLEQQLGKSADGLVPYGIGRDEPLVPNNSVGNRAKNRRVEIYIVPQEQMIETARAGKLK